MLELLRRFEAIASPELMVNTCELRADYVRVCDDLRAARNGDRWLIAQMSATLAGPEALHHYHPDPYYLAKAVTAARMLLAIVDKETP